MSKSVNYKFPKIFLRICGYFYCSLEHLFLLDSCTSKINWKFHKFDLRFQSFNILQSIWFLGDIILTENNCRYWHGKNASQAMPKQYTFLVNIRNGEKEVRRNNINSYKWGFHGQEECRNSFGLWTEFELCYQLCDLVLDG